MNLTTAKHTSSIIIIELKNMVEPTMKQTKKCIEARYVQPKPKKNVCKSNNISNDNFNDQYNTL